MSTRQRRQTNFVVNLSHTFLVLLRRSISAEHSIHLLQGEALGLRNEEPDERRTKNDERAKQDVRPVSNLFQEIRCDLANDEVVKPFRGLAYFRRK
jgi:hypothetical protein